MGRSQYAEILDEAEAMERCARSHRSRASPRRRRRGRARRESPQRAPRRRHLNPPSLVPSASSRPSLRSVEVVVLNPPDPSPPLPRSPSRRVAAETKPPGRCGDLDAEAARLSLTLSELPMDEKVRSVHWSPYDRVSRGERRFLRTFAVVSHRPRLAFNPRPRRLSKPTDAFELHPKAWERAVNMGYRRAAVRTHPDKHPPHLRDAAEANFKRLTASHKIFAQGRARDPRGGGERRLRGRGRGEAVQVGRGEGGGGSESRAAGDGVFAQRALRRVQARSYSHWSPYGRVGVVHAVP